MELTDPPVGDPVPVITHVEPLSAMEYRHDGGRHRYMTRSRSPVDMLPESAEATWHDYAGQSIHSDYRVSHEVGQQPVVTETAAHAPGVMGYDRTAAPGDRQRYMLGNLIGTTNAECEPDGTVSGRTMYTAFGEIIPPPGSGGGPGEVASRYGYAGAWGYQAPSGQYCGPPGEEFLCDPLAELGWLHVGERYYDPQSGRFVQRDPIGIAGGANVYVYVGNTPVNTVDPFGLQAWGELVTDGWPPPPPSPPSPYVGDMFGVRSNISWSDFASYLERHRWDWDFGRGGSFGEIFGSGGNVANVTASTCVGGLRSGIGTPKHHTSWIHKMFPKSAAARAAGRASLIPMMWEGFWDLGVILRYPFDLN